MVEREATYAQAKADAEEVCRIMAASWIAKAKTMPSEYESMAKLVADALTLAGRSISQMEPGFISPKG